MFVNDLTFEDHQRAGRLAIAMLDGDGEALQAVLADLHRSGRFIYALFALVQLAAECLTAAAGGDQAAAAGALRASLVSLTAEALERGDIT